MDKLPYTTEPSDQEVGISPQDLEKVRSLIYKETGMLFEENKNYYLTSRIKQRMAHVQASNFRDYYRQLIFEDRQGEIKSFIEAITINETYFFRDFPQLQGFAENVLPIYTKKKNEKLDFSLKIWSAACSTGEEPYTLSIILQEMIENSQKWTLRIDATDIDRKVLAAAKDGLYGERSMKDTPLIYRQKYFQQVSEGWQVNSQASKLVQFKELNLIDRAEMRKMKGYDFVFCRNVLIYFDDESRKKVVAALYDALLPGGYLFLGHSESVDRITAAFTLERVGNFLCYKKPE